MLLSERKGVRKCGLLDFQDALWGSITYDLVSLLEDARRDVPADLSNQLWAQYGAAFPHLDLNEVRREGCILSAGRHAKILGVFTRLAVRDHKKTYLVHIPRIWGWLAGCLQHPDLADLKAWFDEHIPDRGILLCP
jgi:aminoglycoside/choline kinase family phosphotransferase